LAELDIPDTIQLEFPDPSNILNFNVTIHPDEGKNKPLGLISGIK
jgi:ubiquitin-conjugating enzyme E2 M